MNILLVLLAGFACGLALNEPADGKIYLAAWLDTADSSKGANDGDRPMKYNQRLGYNITSFQYAQNLPITDYPFPYEQIEALESDALVYLTVYPSPSPWAVSDGDIQNLTIQCQALNAAGRKVLLRFAPEMNGFAPLAHVRYWMSYGIQPTLFIPLWKRVYTALKAGAPKTAMVWSPNAGNGWPYGVQSNQLSAADMKLMDTNGNGVLDSLDDPYSPFYPGDDYVDWVGTSNYHFGSVPPWLDNVLPYPNEFEVNLNYGGLYDFYATSKNKPFMISETAATFHSLVDPGPGEVAIKQTWWRQMMTNSTFLDLHPKIKLFCMFEFKKIETDLRDFRVTNNSEVLAAFKADFGAVSNRFVFTNYVAPPVALKVAGNTTGTLGPQKSGGLFQYGPLCLGSVAVIVMIALF